MAAVILFGIMMALGISLFFTRFMPISPQANFIITASLNYAQTSTILSGKGGNEEGHQNENPLITLGKNCLLSYAIPSASPDLVLSKKEAFTYTVEAGDTLSQIAEECGVSLNTLIWANKLTLSSRIQPGQKLEILPISGVKHTVKSGENVSLIAKKYGVSIDRIMEFNDLPPDAFIKIGDELIIPGGTPPTPAPQRTYYASVSPQQELSSSYFIYPTSGRNWGKLHSVNAVDIANNCGTSIYAAAAGRVNIVDEVGWNRGYGKYLTITHPNGVETLYAHFSEIAASPGESVNQGDLIGYMGTTGHSTGCHLHFEVRGAKNPFARY